jgi:predicted permease
MKVDRFAGIRRVLRVRNIEHDIDEELAFHLEQTVDELVAGGMTRGQAEEEAQRRFGNRLHYRRELSRLDRRAESRRRLATWWQDVRYAVRRMGRWPGLTAAVVLTFALGIGANATMFGIIDRLLLRPPEHIAEPERVKLLVAQYMDPAGVAERVTGEAATAIDRVVAYPDYLSFAQAPAFASVAGYSGGLLTFGEGEGARQLPARMVTGNFFETLGVRPEHGRFFGPDEDHAGGAGVAVIGWRMWREQFGGDRSVIGRTLDFGYGPYTIVGVAPENFSGAELDPVDVWLPLHTALSQMLNPATWERRTTTRNSYWLYVVARLAPGVGPEVAESQATALYRGGRIDNPQDDPLRSAQVLTAPLVAGRGPLASGEAAVAMWLAGVSLLVLLIACANVANLLLARALRQQRELGVRLALGISRGRLLAQALTESLLLALLGAVAALLVTRWSSDLIRSVLLPNIAWGETVVSARVLGFVLVLTLLTALLTGLLPALQAHRADVQSTLRSGGRGLSSPTSRVRNLLTVSQAALSVVLLIGAGLFVRSLQRVESLDLGVRTNDVLHIQPVFAPGLTEEQQTVFYREAQERLTRLPGVTHAAASVGVPFRTVITTSLRVPGIDSLPRVGGEPPFAYAVGPGYFGALQLPVIQGRGVLPGDTESAARVAVVNETLARALWPGGDPLGRCMIIGGTEGEPEPPCTEVVGVVSDSRRYDLVETPAMQFYVPLAQNVIREAPHALLARVAADPAAMVPAIQRELLALGPEARFVRVRPYGELLDPKRRSWKLGATMFSVFGVLALVVAAIGMYSVLAFAVAQRTHELGVRAALGATRERLLGMVLGQGVRLAAVGIVIGLGIALLAGGRIAPLLFETSPRDPLTFGVVAAVLLAVAAAAAVLPAWRATRVDPSEALRGD